MQRAFTFFEFFAGGGMARAGLGAGWHCAFANDFDPMKARTYKQNWGAAEFLEGDVALVSVEALPEHADLVWASFPCQDLSLAGKYAGLGRSSDESLTRSGTFWPFWSLMGALRKERRSPRLVVLENVIGTITSHQGRDFTSICKALSDGGYMFGAVIVDAKHFVPQSRPRLFFVAITRSGDDLSGATTNVPNSLFHSEALSSAVHALPADVRKNWVWWKLPVPPLRNTTLADLIDDEPEGCSWHTREETERLLTMMTPLHLAKIAEVGRAQKKVVGSVYKRTRLDADGVKQQRAEVRFDGLSGCLRTPGGGSSRQTIIVVEGTSIQSRLLAPREAARLMGLPDSYKLPQRYNDAYRVAGDGVCVPVVRYLASHLLEPILRSSNSIVRSLAA